MRKGSATEARLDAILVSFDGSLKAVYQDNTVLVLSADSSSFTHVSPAGVKTTQLCEFCLSRFAPLLTELLDLRNQHVDIPAVCRPVLKQLERSEQLFTLHYPITYVCWPFSAEEAFQQNLVELPDNTRVAVFSRCSYARIVLEYTGLRFAVRYPLLVAYHPASNSYTYTWQTQVFSRNQYPDRWQAGLAVATAVADNAAHGFTLQKQQHWQPQQHLADITNFSQLRQQPGSPCALIRCSSACSSSPVRHGSPTRTAAVAVAAGVCSPKRYGSPLQRQHKGWQQQGCQSPTASSPAAAGAALRGSVAWSHCSSPTRMSQQQQQQLIQSSPPAHTAAADSNSTCITQLPISTELLDTLPACLRMQPQRPLTQQQQPTACSSNSRIAAALAQALGHRQGLRAAAASAAAAAGLGRGWWLEPSLLLPSDELLQMVWTREATMLFVQDVDEVEVWLHADDSCLYSSQSGAFVTHLMPTAPAAGWNTTAGAVGAADRVAANAASNSAVSTWHQAAAAAAAASDQRASVIQLGMQLHRLKVPAAAVISSSDAAAAAGCTAPAAAAADAGAETILGLVDGTVDASEMSRVYAASALPELPVAAVAGSGSRSNESSAGGWAGPVVKVPVGQVAARALKFRSTMVRVKRLLLSSNPSALQLTAGPPTADIQNSSRSSRQLANTNPLTSQLLQQQQQSYKQQQQQIGQLSTEVMEEQLVPGVGRFIATKDGRVRVLFDDRTILNLSADGAAASLVMPDGRRRQVAASNPVGVEDYVQVAQEFAAWASTTPAERAAALRMEAIVAAELRSSARMAVICEWGAGRQLPAAVALDAAAQEDAIAAEAEVAAADTVQYPGCQDKEALHAHSGAATNSSIRRSLGGVQSVEGVGLLATDAVARQQAVEDMLQANARVLQRLAS